MTDGKCCSGKVMYALLVIGGLNWGLVGLGGFLGSDLNVVHALLGAWPTVEWVVYLLVGISAIWGVMSCKACCMGMCPAHKK